MFYFLLLVLIFFGSGIDSHGDPEKYEKRGRPFYLKEGEIVRNASFDGDIDPKSYLTHHVPSSRCPYIPGDRVRNMSHGFAHLNLDRVMHLLSDGYYVRDASPPIIERTRAMNDDFKMKYDEFNVGEWNRETNETKSRTVDYYRINEYNIKTKLDIKQRLTRIGASARLHENVVESGYNPRKTSRRYQIYWCFNEISNGGVIVEAKMTIYRIWDYHSTVKNKIYPDVDPSSHGNMFLFIKLMKAEDTKMKDIMNFFADRGTNATDAESPSPTAAPSSTALDGNGSSVQKF